MYPARNTAGKIADGTIEKENEFDCVNKEIAPGTSCLSYTKQHPCLDQSIFYFTCPALNDKLFFGQEYPDLKMHPLVQTHNAEPHKGDWRNHCKVCDLEPTIFLDELAGESVVGPISFSFGPNSLDGKADELDIEQYQVWFADDCGNLLGPKPVETVPVLGRETEKTAKPQLEKGCCTRKAYSIDIKSAFLPKGYKNVSVVVVPDTTSVGQLTIGAVAGYIVDSYVPGAVTKTKAEYGAIRGFGSCGVCVIFIVSASLFYMIAALP